MKYLLLILTLLSEESYACRCFGNTNFVDAAGYSDIVVLAKVRSFSDYIAEHDSTPTKMQVEVIELLKGKLDTAYIDINGQDGVNCLEMLHRFSIGKAYVFNLHNSPVYQTSFEVSRTVFNLSACVESWLLLEDNAVTGAITTSNEEYSKLEKVKSELESFRGIDAGQYVALVNKQKLLYQAVYQKMSFEILKNLLRRMTKSN